MRAWSLLRTAYNARERVGELSFVKDFFGLILDIAIVQTIKLCASSNSNSPAVERSRRSFDSSACGGLAQDDGSFVSVNCSSNASLGVSRQGLKPADFIAFFLARLKPCPCYKAVQRRPYGTLVL